MRRLTWYKDGLSTPEPGHDVGRRRHGTQLTRALNTPELDPGAVARERFDWHTTDSDRLLPQQLSASALKIY